MISGRVFRSVVSGQWTVDGGRWTVDGGRWTVWRPSDYNLRPVFCTPGNRHRSSSCGQAHTQTVCRVTAVRSTGFSRNRTPTEPTSATNKHRFSRIDARGGAGGRGESTPCLLPLGGFAGCLVSREDAKTRREPQRAVVSGRFSSTSSSTSTVRQGGLSTSTK